LAVPFAAAPPPPPAHAPAPATAAAKTSPADANHTLIKSPIVGTYYDAPSPDNPPFVRVGDIVKLGQVLCIIESMKLMNEIESEYEGEIVKVYVENGQPVQYGERLFAVKTT